MKYLLAALSIAVLAIAMQVARGSVQAEAAAQSAAAAWLGLVDAGDYPASWNAASSLFRRQLSQSQWQTAASDARAPLGALKSRKLQSARYTQTLPGAPDGQYVVITFASSFEHKASATETVTPMLDTDGAWRISGYYIR